MNFRLWILFLLVHTIGFAQTGKLSGQCTDAELKTPIPYATLICYPSDGTQVLREFQADEEGNFTVELQSGSYRIKAMAANYDTEEFTQTINPNNLAQFQVEMHLQEDGATLDQIVIKVETNRQMEHALLADQRKAVQIKTSIGAEELSRKGVGDASAAVTKMSGISKQEGSSTIYVRGLGDRYNATYMNGLPVVSNDPEKKNIDLNFFNTDIISHINMDKVYQSETYGDFAGGGVDIYSKAFTGKTLFQIELGSQVNTNAIGQKRFATAQGFSNMGYQQNKDMYKNLSAYSFDRSLNYSKQQPVGGNINLRGGTSFDFKNGHELQAFATVGFNNNYTFQEGYNRVAQAQNQYLKNFDQTSSEYQTNTTAMANLNYRFNNDHKISYNYLFLNASQLKTDIYEGYIRDIAEQDNGYISRSTYTQNQLHIHQLLGQHKINDRLNLNWAGSFNQVNSAMPDRSQNTLRFNNDVNAYVFSTNTTSDNHRYYQNLKENEWASALALDYNLGEKGVNSKGKITLGYNGRFKDRSFNAIQYNMKTNSNQQVATPENLDAFYNQTNFSQGLFSINTYSGDTTPQFYTGDQNIHALFANINYKLSERLFAIVGFRMEDIQQNVAWKTQLDNAGNNNNYSKKAFLPQLTLKYAQTTNQNFRLGLSKTYTLPQFKERALFMYEDVTEVKIGNPDLYASDNYNLDLKWEWFPTKSEVVAVTAFGKYIQNPINEITLASATNDISFINSGNNGYVYGVEFEGRKLLWDFSDTDENKLTAGLNLSYMKTTQDLDSEKVRNETNYNINLTDKRASFTGASNLILNADLSFFKAWKQQQFQSTLVFNYFSDRLYALGTESKGNLVDKGFGTMDLVLKYQFNKKIGMGLTAKNISNPKVKRVQENATQTVDIMEYTKGTGLNLSVNYTF